MSIIQSLLPLPGQGKIPGQAGGGKQQGYLFCLFSAFFADEGITGTSVPWAWAKSQTVWRRVLSRLFECDIISFA